MRPLIALSSRFTETADSWRVAATALGVTYQTAIVRAGGQPVAVPPLFGDAEALDVALDLVARVDGVCIPGGPDVDPHRYGATTVHPKTYGVRAEHDELDLALARAAVALDKPVLAICRGHQVLNVALGGTLRQHIADDVGTSAADAHFRHHHDIELVAGSKAAIAMGALVAHSHCVHHQAVDTLGAGLVVTAWCDDVIEGIELPDRWVVGVQWHPEDDADDEPAQQALFDAFVTASREQSPSRTL